MMVLSAESFGCCHVGGEIFKLLDDSAITTSGIAEVFASTGNERIGRLLEDEDEEHSLFGICTCSRLLERWLSQRHYAGRCGWRNSPFHSNTFEVEGYSQALLSLGTVA